MVGMRGGRDDSSRPLPHSNRFAATLLTTSTHSIRTDVEIFAIVGMTLRAVGCSEVSARGSHSTTVIHFLRDGFEMVRPNTRTVSTEVVQGEPNWNGTD